MQHQTRHIKGRKRLGLVLGIIAAVLLQVTAHEATGQEIPRIYRSAYFLGRGDTGIAAPNDQEAMLYNPAALAEGKGIYKRTIVASPALEFSQATRDLVRELGVEEATPGAELFRRYLGSPQHLGVSNFSGIILRRAALGAFASSGSTLLIGQSPEAAGLPLAEAHVHATAGVGFSIAEGFWDQKFMVGLTGKYLQHGAGTITANAADGEKLKEIDPASAGGLGSGMGLDLGLLYKSPGRAGTSFGLTVSDVGNTQFVPAAETSAAPDPIMQTVNLGLAFGPATKLSRFMFLVDFRDALGAVQTSVFKRLHLGTELSVLNTVGVMGGLNQGYGTTGIYVNLYFIRIDAGIYTEEIGEFAGARGDTRYVTRLTMGF